MFLIDFLFLISLKLNKKTFIILQPTTADEHQELPEDTPSTSGQARHNRNSETEQVFEWTAERRTPEVAAFDEFPCGNISPQLKLLRS